MSKTIESIYSKYLSELNGFEKNLQEKTLVEIEEWREKVKLTLEGSHRIRFSRLKFYEKVEPYFNDDIPFQDYKLSINLISGDFSQAKAILRDAHFKVSADRNKKENIGLLKLIKAREENIDFEIEQAERICGDNPKYPYRSSYYLTKFFQDLGFNYTHDGSTMRFWVRDVLLQLDVVQISHSIENGLFRRKDFKNRSFWTSNNQDLSDDDFLNNAILDFKDFIDESIRVNETVALNQILNLNLNIELLFDHKTETNDVELNKLIDEAKERFLKPNDQNIALEKLWDAFERIKTYYGPKKRSLPTD